MDAKTLEKGQAELSTYFDKSASTVGQAFHGIEQRFITPLLQFGRKSFATWPTTSLYCTIFLALAVPPVLTFIGFSLFTIVALVIVGLCVAFTLSVILVLLFAAILLATLFVNLLIAAILTLVTVLFYGGSSLFVLVRAHGGQGLFMWGEQIKTQLTDGFNAIPKPSQVPNPLKSEKGADKQQNAESDSSEDSAVVVKSEETDSSKDDKTAVTTPTGTASDAMEKGKNLLG